MVTSLVPFEGGIPEQKPNSTCTACACDTNDDGTITYQFNSLGFRGEEPDPRKESIVVIGSSATFGLGVNIEDSWPYKFKKLYEETFQCEVNLLNLSNYNASNETICRRVLTQLSDLRPKLLITNYAQVSYKELFSGEGEPIYISPWEENEESELFYYFYNEANAVYETLHSMLLVQNFCDSENIPHLCGWVQADDFDAIHNSINPAVTYLSTQVDWNRFYTKSCFDEEIFRDSSRDGYHIGPETAAIYAKALFEKYKNLYHTKEHANG